MPESHPQPDAVPAAPPDEPCAHRDSIRAIQPHTRGCEECLALGAPWTLLRLCRTCGHVGCCDTSRSRHATKHWAETGHPIVQLLEAEDETRWCYVDQVSVAPSPTSHRERLAD